MILSAAQTMPVAKSIKGNLEDHYRLIKIAADNGAGLLVFPEMSITGYFRVGASEFAFTVNDKQLDTLRTLAIEHKMIVIAGAPIQIKSKVYIGSFILHPNGILNIYTKQYLHPGEEEFFDASLDYNPIIELGDERISLAICADIDNSLHPEAAGKNSTTLYIPSIFFSKKSMDNCHKTLRQYARQYNMNILMSNYYGHLWGTEAGGKSAFWSNNGKLISELDESSEGIVLVEKYNDNWNGKIIVTNL